MQQVEQASIACEKAQRVFPDNGILVHKNLSAMSEHFRKLPRFVVDYLISSLVDPDDPGPGLDKIAKLMSENFVDSDEKELIKSRIKENGSHHLIGNVKCRYDQSKDEYWAEIGISAINTFELVRM